MFRKKSTAIKQTKSDIVFDIIVNLIMIALLIIIIYPLFFIVIASFSDATAVASGEVIFLPKGINIEGYKAVFQYDKIWTGYKNTILYTGLGTLINIILTITVAYPLTVKTFSGRKVVLIMLMITMYFSGGMIPTYLLVKSLGLLNQWPIMVIMGAISVFNVIIAKSYIEGSIPGELYESSMIDGCSHFTYLRCVVVPLAKPIIAVLFLYYGVAHWNSYMNALLYLNNPDLHPLQLVLRTILLESQTLLELAQNGMGGAGVIEDMMKIQNEVEAMKYVIIIVASVPVLMIYPFLQKYFVQGTMIGAVKG